MSYVNTFIVVMLSINTYMKHKNNKEINVKSGVISSTLLYITSFLLTSKSNTMNSWIHTGLPKTAGKTFQKNSLMKAANVFGAILLLVSMVTFSVASFAQTVTPFTSSTTWTCPVGVTSVSVSCWGAGGGGSTASTNGTRGGGGGGGAFARSSVAVVPGTVYTVTVGSGGGANTAGGDSWFSSNTTILAKGGGGGTNNSSTAGVGGSSTNSIGTIKAAG